MTISRSNANIRYEGTEVARTITGVSYTSTMNGYCIATLTLNTAIKANTVCYLSDSGALQVSLKYD